MWSRRAVSERNVTLLALGNLTFQLFELLARELWIFKLSEQYLELGHEGLALNVSMFNSGVLDLESGHALRDNQCRAEGQGGRID